VIHSGAHEGCITYNSGDGVVCLCQRQLRLGLGASACIGLLSPEEAEEDIALVRSILTGIAEPRELHYARNKASLI